MKYTAYAITLALLIASSTFLILPAHAQTSDSWVSKAPMQQPRASPGIAEVNGFIYAIGGNTVNGPSGFSQGYSGFSGGLVNTVEQYNPASDNWTYKKPMPTARDSFAMAVYQNNIYCIGGRTSLPITSPTTYTAVSEVYDAATNTWQTKAPLPSVEFPLQACVVNGRIYVIGQSGATYSYDPNADTWTNKTKPTLLDYRRNPGIALGVVYDKIFVVGLEFYDLVYDPSNDSWTQELSEMPRRMGNEAVDTGIILSVGGVTTGASAQQRIYVFFNNYTYVYNPFNDTWASGTGMATERVNYGVVSMNDTFYVIGGGNVPKLLFDPYAPLGTTEQYFPASYGTPEASYVLEHSPPNVTIQNPQHQTFNDNNVSVSFSLDKPVSWVAYSLDDEQNVTLTDNSTPSSYSKTTINIADVKSGQHSLVVYTNDTYGNVGVSQTFTFTVAAAPSPFGTTLIVVVVGAIISIVVVLAFYLGKRRRRKAKT